MAAPLLLVAGVSLSAWQAVLLCGVVGATGLLPWRLPLRLAAPLDPVPALLLGLAAALLALLAVDLWWQPLWSYDSWTFWTPKARALAELGGLDERWFTGADVLNPDYPILLPAIEAIGFRFTGYETRLLDLQSWLVLCGLMLALVELLRPRSRGLALGAVLAMLVAAPSVGLQAAAAQADVPLAAFLALSAVLAWIWVEERDHGALALASLFGAAAAATKVEGIAFAAAVLGVAAALTLLRGRTRDAALTAGAAALAIGVATVPWRLWLASVDIGSQAGLGRTDDLGSRLGRIPVATVRLVVGARGPDVVAPARAGCRRPGDSLAPRLATRHGRAADRRHARALGRDARRRVLDEPVRPRVPPRPLRAARRDARGRGGGRADAAARRRRRPARRLAAG